MNERNNNAAPNEDEAKSNSQGVNIGAILLVGAVGAVLVIVIVIATQAWYYSLRDARIARDQHPRYNREMQVYMREQEDRLNRPRWVDEEAGAVAIPIDRAMEIYAQERLESGRP